MKEKPDLAEEFFFDSEIEEYLKDDKCLMCTEYTMEELVKEFDKETLEDALIGIDVEEIQKKWQVLIRVEEHEAYNEFFVGYYDNKKQWHEVIG